MFKARLAIYMVLVENITLYDFSSSERILKTGYRVGNSFEIFGIHWLIDDLHSL